MGVPQPTVPLGMHGLAVYRAWARMEETAEFNKAEWHMLAETAHLVELAAAKENVHVYAEIRQRLRALRLTEAPRSENKPTAAAVQRFNGLRAGRAGLRDPRSA